MVGVDYVPALLEQGRDRAAAEGLDVDSATATPRRSRSGEEAFDAAMSVFGSMFAPDHGRAAVKLVRVSPPGGTIATRKLDA